MFKLKECAAVLLYNGFCDDQEILEEFMMHGMINVFQRPDVAYKMGRKLLANTPLGAVFNILPCMYSASLPGIYGRLFL